MHYKNESKIGPIRKRYQERGFTLLELSIATLVLLVGIVGVVKLVPASLQFDLNNRADTTAMVFAQREMDQIVNQPVSSTTFQDKDLRNISLGSTTVSDTVFGGPAVMQGTSASIDFTAAAVANYNFTFTDPNDPTGSPYEMRWAVISKVNASGSVVSKRFILGCWRRARGVTRPAILDTLVRK